MTVTGSAQTLERFTFAEPHLGTIIELTLYAPEETAANQAAQAAFARVKEMDQIFSDYKSDSEVMRLCETAGTDKEVKVSPELFELLQRSIAISEQTEGAFDVSVGPLVKLWRKARTEKKLPSQAEIAAAKGLVDWRQIKMNEAERTVELKRAGMQLDFGAIAKGYIAQDVSRLLRERGLNQTLVAASGDIVAADPPPGAGGWKIAVAPLEVSRSSSGRLLSLTNSAVSTAGDAFQFVEIDGVRYSHIVDPKTGIGLTHRSSVTTVATDGATADGYDTAICIMGPEAGLKVMAGIENLQALIVVAGDNGLQVRESPGFRQFEIKP